MVVGPGSLRHRLALVGSAAAVSLAVVGCVASRAPILVAPAGSATLLTTMRGVTWSFRSHGPDSGMIRSTNHGQHWRLMLPARRPGSRLVTSYFFGSGTAFALEQPSNARANVTIVGTDDGGTRWWHRKLPGSTWRHGFVPRYQIYFASIQYGWVLASGAQPGHSPGAREKLLLWRTTNGGRSFTRLRVRAKHLQGLSLARVRGCTVQPSIAFANPLSGWLTEGSCGSGPARPYIWRTSDGGRRWSKIALPAPAGGFGRWQGTGRSPGVVAGAPQDVPSGVHAEVLVPVATGRGEVVIDKSTDGGRIWHVAAQVRTGPLSSALGGCFDPITTTKWVLSVPGKLFETGDGGRHWRWRTAGTTSGGPVSFTNLGHGYMQGSGATIALRTEDGGRTWKPAGQAASTE